MLVAGAAAKVKWQRWSGGDPNLKAIAQKNGWFFGTNLRLYRVVRRSATRQYLRNRWLTEHLGQNVPFAPSFFTVDV
jgi:hypothetical protein